MKTSTIRLAALISYAFTSCETPCPISDAALAEIEAAAIQLAYAIEDGALHPDNTAESCVSIGEEIAKLCANGLPPSPAVNWSAFAGN